MNGTRIALEQFEATPGSPPLTQVGSATELDSVPDTCDLVPMDAPPIRRASGVEDAPDENEMLREELASNCRRLADVIAAIEAERAGVIDRAITHASEAVAAVGAELLSSVVDQGIAAEIAAAVADVASRIPHKSIELHVAAADHDPLASAIATHAPEAAITVLSDPDLVSGRARMTWPEGGVVLDADRLIDRIAPLVAERLNIRSAS